VLPPEGRWEGRAAAPVEGREVLGRVLLDGLEVLGRVLPDGLEVLGRLAAGRE
jgi:hypothetical protein